MSESGRPRPAYKRSVSGLIGAILAVLVLILAMWFLTRVQHHDIDDPVVTVDYATTLATARAQSSYPVLAPDPEPPGWRATSVNWTGGKNAVWHLGFLTGDDEYIGIDEQPGRLRDVLADVSSAEAPDGKVTIAGREWDVYTGDTDTALGYEGDEVTVVVSGTADRDQLAGLVESLDWTVQ